MDKEKGKEIIEERIRAFQQNIYDLTDERFGETNTRTNFIDEFFRALGWDIKNHKEVDREFSQRDKSKNSGTKKIDYAFKIDGKVKLFVEAKKPKVDLKNDKEAIYQAKRYAYSSNGRAPIVILTDFEEFRVYNVIKAPSLNYPNRELLQDFSMEYTDYINKWDLLWDTFSKEAVQNGSLDKLAGRIDKNTKKMDQEFLDQITEWREILARHIAIRNKDLKEDEINEAVQRILDRLVFILNLEDRGIEPENTLFDAANKQDIYKNLVHIFNYLDTIYNGLLFKKHFSETLVVDDNVIKDIVKSMCYPKSPFQFNVIEPEILGRIYEKFLGSKIRLTKDHHAKVEEKLEVRKAGGVYYTPEYIVDYIVKNTVAKKIDGLTPEEIKNIKILDPACGSGSFLIRAYDCLLEYHKEWYSKNQKNKEYKKDWYLTEDGSLKICIDKRGEILRNNIFGVDIDREATEVAIMSLYLKMLDDGLDKGGRDLSFVKGQVLPDMEDNIKCGNSLVGPDYFDNNLSLINDKDECKTINPFDWKAEFKEIMDNGGFDIIIGNPPYVDIKGLDPKIVKYYFKKYSTVENRINLYAIFVEKSLILLKCEGYFGFIIPNSILYNKSYYKLRTFILNNTTINKIIRLPDKVFQNVKVETIILILENKKVVANISQSEVIIYPREATINGINIEDKSKVIIFNQETWKSEDNIINISINILLSITGLAISK